MYLKGRRRYNRRGRARFTMTCHPRQPSESRRMVIVHYCWWCQLCKRFLTWVVRRSLLSALLFLVAAAAPLVHCRHWWLIFISIRCYSDSRPPRPRFGPVITRSSALWILVSWVDHQSEPVLITVSFLFLFSAPRVDWKTTTRLLPCSPSVRDRGKSDYPINSCARATLWLNYQLSIIYLLLSVTPPRRSLPVAQRGTKGQSAENSTRE